MVERSTKEVGQDKNMAPDILHHHQNDVLVLLATRRYGSWSKCYYDWNASKLDKHFVNPTPGYLLWLKHGTEIGTIFKSQFVISIA